MARTKKTAIQGEHKWVPVEQLLLDTDNPRLASGAGGKTQEDLLRLLWTEMAVDEVAFSIAANGFFPEEPLLVIPADDTLLLKDYTGVTKFSSRRRKR